MMLAVISREDFSVKSRREKSAKTADIVTVPPSDTALFDRLRAVRKSLADEIGKPAFVVLSDRSLRDLSIKQPTTFDSLQDVFGFGKHKAKTYGEHFLSAIRQYLSEQKPIETGTIPTEIPNYNWFADYERELKRLVDLKTDTENRIEALRAKILQQMEQHSQSELNSQFFSIRYTPAHSVMKFDSKRFKAENEKLYSSYCEQQERAAAIVVRVKK